MKNQNFVSQNRNQSNSYEIKTCKECGEVLDETLYCDFCSINYGAEKKTKNYSDFVWDDEEKKSVNAAIELDKLWKMGVAVYSRMEIHRQIFDLSYKNGLLTESLSRYAEFGKNPENQYFEDLTELVMGWYKTAILSRKMAERDLKAKKRKSLFIYMAAGLLVFFVLAVINLFI